MPSITAHHWSTIAVLLASLIASILVAASSIQASPAPPAASLPAWIDEASGLARSLRHPDLLWTHNDNINHPGSAQRVTPLLYGINPDGQQRTSLELTGVIQRDWESIECALVDDQEMLIVADSGDNRDSWPDYVLWFIPEPETLSVTGKAQVEPEALLRYRYADGPADTEAMTVDPASDQILLLSKREKPPHLYALSLSEREPFPPANGRNEQQRLAEAAVHEARLIGPMGGLVPADPIGRLFAPLTNLPTGMALSADGQLLAVLTYSSLYFFHHRAEQGWGETIRRPIASRSLPHIDQWEGISFSGDGRYVTIVREGSGDGAMLHLAVPEAARTASTEQGRRQPRP